VCAFKQDAFSFGFLAGFERDFPSCFRGPSGLSPTKIAADGEIKKLYLDDMPDRAVVIRVHLSPEEKKELAEFLSKNTDVFAWSTKDLQGVDRDIIEHALDTD
jgi:hypothetical protein